MHKHAIMLKGLLMGLFLFPFISWGQIDVDTEEIGSGSNYGIKFTVFGFPVVTETPFEEDPYYSVYIEYGDGFYEILKTPNANSDGFDAYEAEFEHFFENNSGSPRTFSVILKSTPVKIDGPMPPDKILDIVVPGNSNLPGSLPDYVSDGTFLDIMANWELGIRNGDSLVVIVAKDNSTPSTGVMSLHFRSEYFSPVNPLPGGGDPIFGRYLGGPIIESDAGIGYYDKMIPWFFEVNSQREYLIFTDVLGLESMTTEEYVYLLATIKADPESRRPLAQKTLRLKVHASRDPNDMIVEPDTIFKDEGGTSLVYTINFYNDGSAPVDSIRISTDLPPELDLSSFEHTSAFIRRGESVSLNGVGPGPILTSNKDEVVGGNPTAVWEFRDANLLGTEQGLIDPRFSEGQIVFKINTQADLSDCTSFAARAKIEFLDTTLPPEITEDAIVTCIDRAGSGPASASPWCWIFLISLIIFLIIIWFISPKSKS